MSLPQSFTQMEGWREAFDEAADTLDSARVGSLFAHPVEVLGVRVHELTLRTWTILEATKNPIVSGSGASAKHAIHALWIMRSDWRVVGENSLIARLIRAWRTASILIRNRDDDKIIEAVVAHLDPSFLDMPGRFMVGTPNEQSNPIHHPRVTAEIYLAGEVMRQFPSMTFRELSGMPLAQFWQWLHRARKIVDPEYRNEQITDQVNKTYLSKFNALRRAEKAFKDAK